MALKISNNSLIYKHYLMVDSGGIRYYENALLGGMRRVPFSGIDCVLMSADQKLSLQMGNRVFSLKVNPQNPKHQAVIDALLQEVRRTAMAGAAA